VTPRAARIWQNCKNSLPAAAKMSGVTDGALKWAAVKRKIWHLNAPVYDLPAIDPYAKYRAKFYAK
jgi:hypothetical protein